MSISFTVTGSTASFAVVSLVGDEAISSPFRFAITLVSATQNVDPGDIVGKQAVLEFSTSVTGGKVPYHGIVTRFEQHQRVGSGSSAMVYYSAVLKPRLSRLARARGSAVFVDVDPDNPTKTVKHVISSVLDPYKNRAELAYAFEQLDEAALRKRAYRCQFQETDLQFISRLMEAEGLFYYFKHDAVDKDTLIISNLRAVHADAPRATAGMAANRGNAQDDQTLDAWFCRQSVLPKKVVLRDYNYDRAATDNGEVKSEAQVQSTGSGEVSLYGEDALTQAEGDTLAAIRAQELHCRGRTFGGDGGAKGLRAGTLFKISAHYNASMNGKKYLVTQLHHEASENVAALIAAGDTSAPTVSNYRVGVTAIPHDEKFDSRDVVFRPQRTTTKPRIYGTINARIDDSTSGDSSDLDAKGRYKVALPFVDRTNIQAGKCSHWIRLATPYSGPPDKYAAGAAGMHLPLRKNTEVLLSFIEGDPDRPVIVGALPNSANASVVTQSSKEKNVIKTGGGNLIELDDTRDKTRIKLSAPYNTSSLTLGWGGDPKDGVPKPSILLQTAGTYKQDIGVKVSLVAEDGQTFAFGEMDWEKAMGVTTDEEKNADKQERVIGSKATHTRGNVYTRTRGNTTSYFWGNAYSAFMGAREDQFFGNSLSTWLGTKQEFSINASLSVWAGGQMATWLGGKAEFAFGATFGMLTGSKTDLIVGAKSETIMGSKTEVLVGNATKIVSGTVVEAHGGVKVSVSGTDMKTAASKLETELSKIGLTQTHLDAVTTSLKTATTSLNSGAISIDTKGISIIS